MALCLLCALPNCYVARFQLPPEAPQAVSIGLRNCLWGTFWAPLKSFKSLKSPAAAFEGLWTAKFSAAACEGVLPALPRDLSRPHKLFLLGFETATVARFQLLPEAPQAVSIGLRNCYVARFEHHLKASKASKASKAPQQLSKAFEPQNPPQQLAKASRLLCHGTSRGPTSCFYWASKLPRGTFLGIP